MYKIAALFVATVFVATLSASHAQVVIPPIVITPPVIPAKCQNLPQGSFCVCSGSVCTIVRR